MRCTVVIPCRNGAELTRLCVESLLCQNRVEELEILLIDNASEDETAELVQLHPSVRCLRQATNLGFAGGVNVGLRAAKNPIVVVLNNDTQAASSLLLRLHRTLVADPRIGSGRAGQQLRQGPRRTGHRSGCQLHGYPVRRSLTPCRSAKEI